MRENCKNSNYQYSQTVGELGSGWFLLTSFHLAGSLRKVFQTKNIFDVLTFLGPVIASDHSDAV